MRTYSQAAPEPAPSVAGGGQSRGRSLAWRLPIAYRAIPATALAIDLALIFASAIGAEILYHSLPSDLEGEFAHTMAAATFVAVLFVAAMRVQKLYSPNRLILMDDQARSVLSAWCGAFLILASGVFTWGVSHDLSRGDILLFWALGAATLLAHRVFWWAALPRALESGALRGRTVVSLTCEDAIPQRFVENLTRHGYHIVAHFIFRLTNRSLTKSSITPSRYAGLRNRGDRSFRRPRAYVPASVDRKTPARASVAGHIRAVGNSLTTVSKGPQRYRRDGCDRIAARRPLAGRTSGERVVDIVVSLAALVLLSPLMLAAAIAIKLDLEGPVFFRQTRHGFSGRPFGIYKFRSMTVLENGDVVRQAEKRDARVTRVGYWIWRYSIDELPQLLNVLYGDMSIVGPRPHASSHDRYFMSAIEKYAFRHHVKSGMTGWAQVSGSRGKTETLEKIQKRVELDLWYMNIGAFGSTSPLW